MEHATHAGPRTARADAGYVARTLWNWLYSNLHNVHGSYKVVEFAHLRRLGPGLLDPAHPWATGVSPHTGGPVWPGHILFATPPKERWTGVPPDPDEVIVTRIGRFLAAMVQRSTAADPEIPQGARRRMPHAVNYLHGAIHFSGAFVLFNDFAEARAHLDDPAFLREVRRFARAERREFTLVVRERRYDPVEFAWFTAFVRARLPWYANPNGPGDRVQYGTPSPYPAVNIINGSWVREMEKLRRGRLAELARPPIDRARWFQGTYGGPPVRYTAMERFHAWATYQTIRVKGFQGGLVFTRRRRIEPGNWQKYLASGGRWRAEVPIPGPFPASAPHEPNETRGAGLACTQAASRFTKRTAAVLFVLSFGLGVLYAKRSSTAREARKS